MAGDVPLGRDHRRGPAQQRGPAGQGLGRHQDRPVREAQRVGVLADDKDRSGADAGGRRHAAFQAQACVGRRLWCLAGPHRRKLLQRAALQQDDVAVRIEGPFDVPGLAVLGLDADGQAGQGQHLVLGERWPVPLPFGRLQAADPLVRMAGELLGLGTDFTAAQGQGRGAGHDEQIRRTAAVHHRLGQSPGAVDDHRIVAQIERVAGVEHPGSGGRDHLHAADTHGHIFVAQAPVEPVTHGGDPVFARHDLLVGLDQICACNVEFATVLAGEGGAGQIFAQGAAAHRQAQAGSRTGGKIGQGGGDGRGQILRQQRVADEPLDVGAQGVELVEALGVGRLQASVDLGLQVVVGHETGIAGGCDHEAGRDA